MTDFLWLLEETVLAVHEQQLAEHGGGVGIRDRGLLESALMRPKQLDHYENADIASVAGAYAYGLAKNHPFIDGNKRVSFAVMEIFLLLNGVELVADDAECVTSMLQLAAGELTEEDFSKWIRQKIQLTG